MHHYLVLTTLIILSLPSNARAQSAYENSPEVCQDRIDNDGDGFVDCSDFNCSHFAFCSNPQAAPNPAQSNQSQPTPINPGVQPVPQSTPISPGALQQPAQTSHQMTPQPHSPQYQVGPAVQQPQTPAAPVRPSRRTWARGAAIVGFSSMPFVLGFGVASSVTAASNPGIVPAVPLGASATIILGINAPIVEAGAISARKNFGVRGCLGCTIAGWIGYGATMIDAISLIAIGASGGYISPYLIASVTALGIVTLSLFSSGALVAANQARRLQRSEQSQTSRRGFAIAPFAVPLTNGQNLTGGVLGVSIIL